MNRENAIEILGPVDVYEDMSLFKNRFETGQTLRWDQPDGELELAGFITAEQLKALVWWIETYGESDV